MKSSLSSAVIVAMMHRFDPGAGNPDEWTAVDVAAVLDVSLSMADEAYAIMDNEDWIAYCREIARVKFGQS
jgi:hypothetical protein